MPEDTLHALTEAEARIGRREESMEALLAEWCPKPVVAALPGRREGKPEFTLEPDPPLDGA